MQRYPRTQPTYSIEHNTRAVLFAAVLEQVVREPPDKRTNRNTQGLCSTAGPVGNLLVQNLVRRVHLCAREKIEQLVSAMSAYGVGACADKNLVWCVLGRPSMALMAHLSTHWAYWKRAAARAVSHARRSARSLHGRLVATR